MSSSGQATARTLNFGDSHGRSLGVQRGGRPPRIIAIKQVAALPFQDSPSGLLEVLLITSRTTKRWVIPKGNPIRGLLPHLAAAREAFEEAGISGLAKAEAIGSYGYAKVRNNGTTRPARVDVFPLAVHRRAEHWPEQHERETTWFGLIDAADAVEEPELKAIIAGFRYPAAA